MNNKFDELTKQMAQSVTRREALKVFGAGVAGMALACVGLAGVGLANTAKAGGTNCLPGGSLCHSHGQCCSGICAVFQKGSKLGNCYG